MLGFQSRAPQPSVADLHKCKAPNTHRNGGMLRVGCSRPPGKPWAWEVVAAPADVCGRQRCGSNEADEGRGRLLAATCRSLLKQDIQTIRRPQPKADSVRMIAKGRRRRGPLGPCWAHEIRLDSTACGACICLWRGLVRPVPGPALSTARCCQYESAKLSVQVYLVIDVLRPNTAAASLCIAHGNSVGARAIFLGSSLRLILAWKGGCHSLTCQANQASAVRPRREGGPELTQAARSRGGSGPAVGPDQCSSSRTCRPDWLQLAAP